MRIKLNTAQESIVSGIVDKTGISKEKAVNFLFDMGLTFIVTVQKKRATLVVNEFNSKMNENPDFKAVVDIINKSVSQAPNLKKNPKKLQK